MKPRHRALMRLARRVPFVRESADRHPAQRIGSREVDTRPARAVPGDSVKLAFEVRIKKLRTAKAGPHAPLLIRLVRHPYAHRVARMVRRVEESRVRLSTLGREPFPNAVQESSERRAAARVVPPMRELVHAPVERARPFARARAAVEDADRETTFDVVEEDWI